MTTGGLHTDLPDGVPLILKASCEDRVKRIRFAPDLQHLSFAEVQRKVAHALQFDDVDFCITWQDDDGERCDITSNEDLREALFYFTPSTPSPVSTTTTTNGLAFNDELDGSQRSLGATQAPIVMHVSVRVETAVSLSDFGSSVWSESDVESNSDVEWAQTDAASQVASSSKGSTSRDRIRLSSPSAYSIGSSRASASSYHRPDKYPYVQPSKAAPSTASSHHSWQNGTKQRRSQNSTQVKASSSASSQSGLESLSSLSLTSHKQESDADSDSDDSVSTRAPRARRHAAGGRNQAPSSSIAQTSAEVPNGFNVHVGIACKTCLMNPIIGVRYHCASCVKGADFCAECERTGAAVRKSSHHSESHLMIKLATPMHENQDVADALGAIFNVTTQRLLRQATSANNGNAGSIARSNDSTQAAHQSPLAAAVSSRVPAPVSAVTNEGADLIKCSFCSTLIVGVRYLCANCPILSASSHDGYNLCHACEVHSLKCHDPSHFFLKISPAHRLPPAAAYTPRLALGDRWDVQEITKGGPLLPCLYAELEPFDPFVPANSRQPGGGNSNGNASSRNQTVRIGDGFQIESNDQGDRISIGNGAIEIQDARPSNSLAGSMADGLARWSTPWRRSGRDIELQRMRQARSRHIVPLENLFHPSILCDSCYQVVHGAWYRCCHCTSSYDLCGTCMSRIAHDHTHAFAVFKQPVDLDLFKSCVDHQDSGDSPGASRPMLAFPLT